MIFAVTGGKGGTGKSTIATNLAIAISTKRDTILLDADVEEPNDFILLGKSLENEVPIKTIYPEIDTRKCTYCMKCVKICPEGAIVLIKGKPPVIFDKICSGCGLCFYECEDNALIKKERIIGYTYLTEISKSLKMITGKLVEGEERAYPIVLAAKRRALESYSKQSSILIVDTSAGTSNSVAASLKGSEFAIAVTEPTPLGAHDLELILSLLKKLSIPAYVIINRTGIGPEDEILRVSEKYGAEIIARIPYSERVIESYINSEPIVQRYPESDEALMFFEIADKILEGSL